MGDEMIKEPDKCFQSAERRALQYYEKLYKDVKDKAYMKELTKDFQVWSKSHIQSRSLSALFSKVKINQSDYHSYIKMLDKTGKLGPYLNRSISYIYLRDLGKTLDSNETKKSIQKVIGDLTKNLTQSKKDPYSFVWLYRKAEEKGIDSTFIWLMEKLKTVSTHLPEELDAEQAQRKLIKIIAGVFMHAEEEMETELSTEERAQRLEQAIRLGYSYGLTYPFIDDLLDAKILSPQEEKQYSSLIRSALITGNVPEFMGWKGENKEFIRFVHSELKEAFLYIKTQQLPETRKKFFEQAFVFFQSQEIDRMKNLTNSNYTNEQLYIPIILKSSSSRIIARSILSTNEDEGFDNRTFLYGIYNQLADDFSDMFQDLEEGAVTPYTYYMKYHKTRRDLINPFELYWTVVSNLIHNVYNEDKQTCEIILNRAINGLIRFKKRWGDRKYKEVMDFLAFDSGFHQKLERMVEKAVDVDFFDKLLRDHMITTLKSERNEREYFQEQTKYARNRINDLLPIAEHASKSVVHEPIIEAANYSLKGDGKRIRPIVTWMMGIQGYGLKESDIAPLLRSLEYMHTASLIFDDLPSQDNASKRRGRPTIHNAYNTAIAELTGLYLTQKAVEEQSSLSQFDTRTVLRLIQYSAQVAEKMCRGQAMDLHSKGKQLTIEQLNTICLYKTGLGFEASLILPAILAQADEEEMNALKKFAAHAGIAFQIKDDLLDVDGDESLLGKPTGKDKNNNSSTFVAILGYEGAKKEMWQQYCLALEALQEVARNLPFLKQLMNYIIHRER